MYYVYHIMEKIFSGSSGIENWCLCEYDSLEKAKAYGTEASKTLMMKYSPVANRLAYRAFQKVRQEHLSDDRYDEILDELYDENVLYELYAVKTGIFKNYFEVSKKFYDNRKAFIDEFCELII